MMVHNRSALRALVSAVATAAAQEMKHSIRESETPFSNKTKMHEEREARKAWSAYLRDLERRISRCLAAETVEEFRAAFDDVRAQKPQY